MFVRKGAAVYFHVVVVIESQFSQEFYQQIRSSEIDSESWCKFLSDSKITFM